MTISASAAAVINSSDICSPGRIPPSMDNYKLNNNHFDCPALYFVNRRKAKLDMGGTKTRKKDQKYVFNVGGVRHETYRTTLYSVPNTRLYSIAKKNPRDAEEFDAESREFFFDRHPGAFEQIINFYRTGKLHCPMDICGPMFEEELRFWGIEEKLIEPCCWMNYIKHRDAEASMNLFEGNLPSANSSDDEAQDMELSTTAAKFGMSEVRRRPKTQWERVKPKVWRLIDDPYSSFGANILTLVSMTFIVVSIVGFCLETHPWGRVPLKSTTSTTASSESPSFLSAVNNFSHVSAAEYPPPPGIPMGMMGMPPSGMPKAKTVPHEYLTVIDYICSIWFTVEFIARLIFCPNRVVFFKTMLNLIDLLAIVPFYVQILADNTDLVVSMWEIIKILRIFRVFKLCRHVIGLKVLVHTLRASAKELILLIVFLVLGVVIFSSLLHYAESNTIEEEFRGMSEFDSIPGGFWWAVITMTTIGYGDQVPQTLCGRIVGALCAICGVLTISLPVPVIVNNFTLYYNHAQARLKLPKKKRIDKLAGAAEALKYQKNEEAVLANSSGGAKERREEESMIDGDSDFETVAARYLQMERTGSKLTNPNDSGDDFGSRIKTTTAGFNPNSSLSIESVRFGSRPGRGRKHYSRGVKLSGGVSGNSKTDSIFITTFSDNDNSESELNPVEHLKIRSATSLSTAYTDKDRTDSPQFRHLGHSLRSNGPTYGKVSVPAANKHSHPNRHVAPTRSLLDVHSKPKKTTSVGKKQPPSRLMPLDNNVSPTPSTLLSPSPRVGRRRNSFIPRFTYEPQDRERPAQEDNTHTSTTAEDDFICVDESDHHDLHPSFRADSSVPPPQQTHPPQSQSGTPQQQQPCFTLRVNPSEEDDSFTTTTDEQSYQAPQTHSKTNLAGSTNFHSADSSSQHL